MKHPSRKLAIPFAAFPFAVVSLSIAVGCDGLSTRPTGRGATASGQTESEANGAPAADTGLANGEAPASPPPTSLTPGFETGIGVMLNRVDIPIREGGYHQFDSRVIASADELKDFFEAIADKRWSGKPKFLATIEATSIDFDRSSLLLLRDTRGSGSIRVWVETPRIVGDELVFKVAWKSPGYGTKDMAYRCFAYVVPRDLAERIRIVGARTSSRRMEREDGTPYLRRGHANDIMLPLAAPVRRDVRRDANDGATP